jgi:hypothetical protein
MVKQTLRGLKVKTKCPKCGKKVKFMLRRNPDRQCLRCRAHVLVDSAGRCS